MAKEEKTLSEQDRKRIEQEARAHATYGNQFLNDDYMNFKEGAEYEHKYQREQQAQTQRENLALRSFLLSMSEGSAYLEKKVEVLFASLKK